MTADYLPFAADEREQALLCILVFCMLFAASPSAVSSVFGFREDEIVVQIISNISLALLT